MDYTLFSYSSIAGPLVVSTFWLLCITQPKSFLHLHQVATLGPRLAFTSAAMQIHAHTSSSVPCPPHRQKLKGGLQMTFSPHSSTNICVQEANVHVPLKTYFLNLMPLRPHIHALWRHRRSQASGDTGSQPPWPSSPPLPHASPPESTAGPLDLPCMAKAPLARSSPVRARVAMPRLCILALGQNFSEGLASCPGDRGVSSCSRCGFALGLAVQSGDGAWSWNQSLGAKVAPPPLPVWPQYTV